MAEEEEEEEVVSLLGIRTESEINVDPLQQGHIKKKSNFVVFIIIKLYYSIS